MVDLGSHVCWGCDKATLPCTKVKQCRNGALGWIEVLVGRIEVMSRPHGVLRQETVHSSGGGLVN